ncbi:tRNA dihydrouridine synthase DusB [Pajaroellobacter abortibovis]|uniref:tRNA dihydrouridine synthase DusB n=1 Tax=Pajaroellobacter abortibovis TaxID=1882918 RepID=UPI001FEBD6A4|nr:tRNA dihydrouridine synthase DusB [Pajaroellobacter abortibovis]
MSEAFPLFQQLFTRPPAILAPMEDVSDHVFRHLCRLVGADICFTEFVNVEGLLRKCPKARRKIHLLPTDRPTAIQIYGSDPERLAEAASVAADANPTFVDINCGCWIPRIVKRGAGAGWLRDPHAMIAMVKQVVQAIPLPVTVKTRIGYGSEASMPIVDLARRLEDVGVQAITIHCRTASAGYTGTADWTWAQKARDQVSIPVIVNGDIKSGLDAKNALEQTGCHGVMIGRRAIEHPWIFREIRAMLDHQEELPSPTLKERIDFCRKHLLANVEARGERYGIQVTRRHLSGYFKGIPGAASLRQEFNTSTSLDQCLSILDTALTNIPGSP